MIVTGKELSLNSNCTFYNGNIIHSRFAYKFFRGKTNRMGNIIAFISPMVVEGDNMVDLEDRLNKDHIYSEKAINFCMEIPDIDLFGGICFQRLFNSHIATILASKYLKCEVEVDGDDIIVHKEHLQGGIVQSKGKASVSIAKWCNNAVLIHTGINIIAGKQAPAFAFSTNLTDEQSNHFMNDCILLFNDLTKDIFLASSKVV